MVVKLMRGIKGLLNFFSFIIICTLVIITAMQVMNRYLFKSSFTWVEELGGIAMIYITYFGAAMATINKSNTRIEFFINKLPNLMYKIVEILDDCICITFLVVICYFSWKLVSNNMQVLSVSLKIPLAINYLGVFLGCILMIIFYVLNLWIDTQKLRGKDMAYVEEELSK